MDEISKNTNKKNIGQISKNNPGWKGKGEPNFKAIIFKLATTFKTNLLSGDLKLLINNLKSASTNISTFIFKKSQENFVCPCCSWSGPGFITTCNSKRVNYNSNCPNCDSRSRHRGLSLLLPIIFENKLLDLLFFAPEKILLKIMSEKLNLANVKTTDFYSSDVDYPGEDIQNLSFSDHSFNYILCNHVIEHVPHDDLAFKELSRILKPQGKAIITIPGDYHLNETVVFEQTDSNGHFRHYGLDVIKKMKTYFTEVETLDMHTLSSLDYGIRINDLAFICTK
ncbi:MAG: class I SAM-dependent methyltransferase [Psychroserpens sp.]|uniref:methyltransferase domain-containing protein n=1 Tax=Psychroserpens sp. TaxID=2020870 RepID=UPI003CA69C9A